ncbi:glycosyltransferase family 2 protein [Candidatus Roizmanbacteria bacterium]|nr:MAG: glycosyltransferase family 2 protein [Candidatus Roizmanbacteria bacterium]
MLTGIVIAKNEAEIVQQALKSLSFCDELLLIDNNSTDETGEIAHEAGARVIYDKTSGNFSNLRNLGAEQAKGNWLLYLDADEEISPDLRANIRHEMEQPSADAYYLRRRDRFMGRVLEHGEVAKVYKRGIIRLMKKGSGLWKGSIHEEWTTVGRISSLDGFIEHYPHQTIHEFLQHINTYSQIRADELFLLNKRTNMYEIVAFPIGKFLYTYVIKGGLKDGTAGFVYSFLMSFHSFLVRSTLFIKQMKHE